MNFMAAISILILCFYARKTAALSLLLDKESEFTATLTPVLAPSSPANFTLGYFPPDPWTRYIPSIGWVIFYSFNYSRFDREIDQVLIRAVRSARAEIAGGRANQPIDDEITYLAPYATLTLHPSPQLTWTMFGQVLLEMNDYLANYTHGQFLFHITGGPGGLSNGSLTTP